MSYKRRSIDLPGSSSKRPRLEDDVDHKAPARHDQGRHLGQTAPRSNGHNHSRNGSNGNSTTSVHMTAHKPSIRRPTGDDSIPTLPPISSDYETPVFTHPSLGGQEYHSASSQPSSIHHKLITYDRLEFLGDAYIELIASRLIWSQYQHLPTGRMSQLRELLVKNETLSQFSIMYGFDRRLNTALHVTHHHHHSNSTKGQKVNGDVFEAYIAAVALSDPVHGFEIAEDWLGQLWRPLLEGLHDTPSDKKALSIPPASSITTIPTHKNHSTDSYPAANISTSKPTTNPIPSLNPLQTPNLNSKESLAKLILCPATKLEYLETQPAQIHSGRGLETYHMGVFFSGFAGKYTRVKLGEGEGQSKSAAGQMAASRAMEDSATKELLQGLKEEKRVWVERRNMERERGTGKAS